MSGINGIFFNICRLYVQIAVFKTQYYLFISPLNNIICSEKKKATNCSFNSIFRRLGLFSLIIIIKYLRLITNAVTGDRKVS